MILSATRPGEGVDLGLGGVFYDRHPGEDRDLGLGGVAIPRS
ncbi:MAG: hypothetical protein WKF66_12850 [Pedobacter sp.]